MKRVCEKSNIASLLKIQLMFALLMYESFVHCHKGLGMLIQSCSYLLQLGFGVYLVDYLGKKKICVCFRLPDLP